MKKTLLLRLTLIVIALLLLVVGGVLFYFKSYLPNQVAPRAFPQIEGEVRLPGLKAPVDVYRDRMGIPHIYAGNVYDLFFAQGYVHAQDRFWQMDFWRHIGSGRLSEMFGQSSVKTDMFLRTLGWRHVAEQEYHQLSDEARFILNAYADGVNAYLQDRRPEEISLEYAVLRLLNPRYVIEPWTPIHSLTWGKAMAWDLGGNLDEEIERAILLKTLTPEQVAELFPGYPAEHPVIVPQIGENVGIAPPNAGLPSPAVDVSLLDLQGIRENLTRLNALLAPRQMGIGSNSWAIAGSRTVTGKPYLANDMHLGVQIPSIWYQIALHCEPKSEACPFEVTGFSFAGVPGVIAGHNDRIAWGFTNLGPDVQDLFIEKVNPENPNQYEFNGQWVDFETRQETIHVAGGEPVTITVRISRHGPIISDTFAPLKDEVDPKAKATPFKDRAGIDLPSPYAIALSWTALTPNSPFEALWGFNRAQNWQEFREAARKWSVPAQNLLYADVDGNIGYQMPGVIPIRKNGDGTLPVPGWTGEYDWIGFIPFEEMPYLFNPASGYIVTANNQAHPREYPYLVTKDWDYGHRAARIVEMIEQAPGKIDLAYLQAMHADSKNLNAAVLVPALLSLPLEGDLAAIRDQVFAGWEYQQTADSQAAAVFEWFWWNLLHDTFKDDLPEEYLPSGGSRWYLVMKRLLEQPDSPWWDNRQTEAVVERRDDILRQAFEKTVRELRKEYGKDVTRWPRWGQLHTVTFDHPSLGRSGISLIEDLFNRGPFETGGGSGIVNATGWKVGESFQVTSLPSEREIVDLSNLDASLAIHTTGQSGHADHPHYIDMAPLWAAVQYAPMWWEKESVIADAEGHLRLVP